jgi:hypothetical protein
MGDKLHSLFIAVVTAPIEFVFQQDSLNKLLRGLEIILKVMTAEVKMVLIYVSDYKMIVRKLKIQSAHQSIRSPRGLQLVM